jgi:hypothetical protein
VSSGGWVTYGGKLPRMRTKGGGSTAFGYRLVERPAELVEVPSEQAVLFLIGHLRRSGWSMPAIAEELNKLGLRTRARCPWSKQAIHLILRRGIPVADLPAEDQAAEDQAEDQDEDQAAELAATG